ncbi:LOW QUALITY PROTEIN: hypothetical protein HID58_061011, partial [Brassica napus]
IASNLGYVVAPPLQTQISGSNSVSGSQWRPGSPFQSQNETVRVLNSTIIPRICRIFALYKLSEQCYGELVCIKWPSLRMSSKNFYGSHKHFSTQRCQLESEARGRSLVFSFYGGIYLFQSDSNPLRIWNKAKVYL